MKPNPALLLVLACAPCWSQPAAAPASPPVVAGAAERGEPDVRRSVTEDDGAKIDELRVRGQVTRVVVTPKVGVTKSYEIILGRNGRAAADGTGGSDSAIGKRVWNVLAF